jgi:hypothetical protein
MSNSNTFYYFDSASGPIQVTGHSYNTLKITTTFYTMFIDQEFNEEFNEDYDEEPIEALMIHKKK